MRPAFLMSAGLIFLITSSIHRPEQFVPASYFPILTIYSRQVTDQDQKYVYVVGPGNVAQRKDVVTGGMADGLRVIQSGLALGDKVIVSGLQQIYVAGTPVTPTQVAMGFVTASGASTPSLEARK